MFDLSVSECRSRSVPFLLVLLLATAALAPAPYLLAGELPPILFASREFGSDLDPLAIIRARDGSVVERARRGRLLVLEPRGDLRVLVEPGMPGAPADVADPDVSFDGQRIVFAGYSGEESAWRIYEIRADGTGLRRITRSDRDVDLSRFGEAAPLLEGYDDVDPCYLPDGRICFVSTRLPGIAPDSRMRSSNLYVVNADGSDLHRITSERFGADTPTVDPTTGEIVYSRWWRSPPRSGKQVNDPDLDADGNVRNDQPVPPGSPGYGNPRQGGGPSRLSDVVLGGLEEERFPGLNSWFLASIRPDGDGMKMFSGTGLDRRETQAYRPAFLPDGRALGFFLPTTPFLGNPGNFGLRVFHRGDRAPLELGGPQNFLLFGGLEDFLGGFPAGIPGIDPAPFVGFFYASAAPLPDGRVLVTATAGRPVDYDIYIEGIGRGGLPVKVHGIAGMADVDAVPLVPRRSPPVLRDESTSRMDDFVPHTVREAFERGGKFTFRCENIFSNPPVDSPLPGSVPVGKKLFIEFFMNPQRTSPEGRDEPILIGRKEIGPDGAVEMELPAGVPLFEVIRRADDQVAVGRDGQIFHVGGHNFSVKDVKGRCVGCHAGHTLLDVPTDPSWINLAPSAVVRSNSARSGINVFRPDQFLVPLNLVDRSTDPESIWAAAAPLPESEVTLRWSVPVVSRQVTIHGVGPEPQRAAVTVRNLTVTTYLDGKVQSETASGTILPDGTSIAMDSGTPFDTLRIGIRREDVSGTIDGRTRVAALAEVVVEGKVVEDARPGVLAIRSDANCDGKSNISDAVVILTFLFLGGDPLCCEAAADVDGNDRINLTDPIRILLHHFLGGEPIGAPFPLCGRVVQGNLSCHRETCFDSDVANNN